MSKNITLIALESFSSPDPVYINPQQVVGVSAYNSSGCTGTVIFTHGEDPFIVKGCVEDVMRQLGATVITRI